MVCSKIKFISGILAEICTINPHSLIKSRKSFENINKLLRKYVHFRQKCDIIVKTLKSALMRRTRMITKVQGKTLTGEIAARKETRLSALEKAMLKWAVVDPEDRILDADIGSGMMAEYLRRNMQCEVCGVSEHMEHVRYARSRLQSCDNVYAAAGDIPWLDDAFDIVFMKASDEETDLLEKKLSEARRVLRPGGQLILGAVSYPPFVSLAASLLADASVDEKHFFSKSLAIEILDKLGYAPVTWQRTGFATGVLIAWKAKPDMKQVKLEH